MIRDNKWKCFASSLLILLPMLAGLVLWDRLPQGSAMIVFGMPCSELAVHWVCLLITALDQRNRGQSRKAMSMVFWIVPMISIFSSGMAYRAALGYEITGELMYPVMIGLMFLGFGNYLPKIRRNRTLGIKVRWTLDNEENWNRTHRFSGKLWVAGGLALVFSVLLPEEAMVATMVVVLLILAVVPVVYSYRVYREQKKAGTYVEVQEPRPKYERVISRIALGFVAVLLVFLGVIVFTGDISIHCGNDSLQVQASYWEDLAVDYGDIQSVEYRDSGVPGYRVWGFGTQRLLMGQFSNEEFGSYTRYTYTDCESCIVLDLGSKILVIGARDAAETRAIYEALMERVGE